jgi:hypothetical protein
LTLIRHFVQAIVAFEVSHDQFTIRTDKPNVGVLANARTCEETFTS